MSFSQPAENRSGKHSIWHANSWVCKKKKNSWGWSEAAGRRYIFIWCLSYSFMYLIKPGHSICVQKGSSRKSKWLLRATELLGHHDKIRRLPHSPNNRLQGDPCLKTLCAHPLLFLIVGRRPSALASAGLELLYQPEVVRLYLSLLTCSHNHNTLEAAAGALQNLAAGHWTVSGWQKPSLFDGDSCSNPDELER